jgi:hypothetical protein
MNLLVKLTTSSHASRMRRQFSFNAGSLHYFKLVVFAAAVLVSTIAIMGKAHAVFIGNIQGGADFPAGAISFADAVLSYSPALVAGEPTDPHRGAFNALGVPDYTGVQSCFTQAACSFVSLGNGGSIVLRFDDNKLTGSGDNKLDIWVFEVGDDIEDTFVDISSDGVAWHSVGKVFGSTAGIDIDAFGFGPGDHFSFIRLTDDPNEGALDGYTVGADIDAVGAISTIAKTQEVIVQEAVPEPRSVDLVSVGCLGFLLLNLVRVLRSSRAFG